MAITGWSRSSASPITNFVRVFPRNIELEARLTFVSARARARGRQHRRRSPAMLSFVVRHSLIALPDARLSCRAASIRAPGRSAARSSISSAPLGSPVVYELANRFRLERLDPGAPRSRVRNPIVFYIDRAAPEPIRTALLEGVSWWREAFDAAGYIDAFRVEILPEGIDPLDVRYNVVHWVNRATRGWSYGQVIEDPRTGEIIKGQVLLGSLRVRQDMMIFQALVGARLTATGDPNDPVTAALARIRQLAAHEVGHALGLAHNFAGSIQGRYSVMDYPAPRVRLVDGALDLTDAYGVGVGRWDRFAVDWLYGAETDADAAPRMNAALAEGLRYVGDDDARPAGAAHPFGSLWDDGADPVAELRRMMAVREVAVSRFGPGALAPGEPESALRRAFVPIWLIHRYQVEAAVKLLGGVDFAYAVNGDGHGEARIVPPADQRRRARRAARHAVAGRPDRAAGAAAAISPRAGRETMTARPRSRSCATAGGPVFDPLAATETGAALTLASLLAPERLNRLEIQHQADPASPGAHELVDRLIERTFDFAGLDESQAAVQRRIATTTALALARVQRDPGLSPTLALALSERLNRLAARLDRAPRAGLQADWSGGLARLLGDREALDQAIADRRRLPRIPPGMPIGAEGDWMDF